MTDTRRTDWDRLAHVARSFPGQRVALAGRHPSPQILTTHAASMLLSGEPMPWTVANPVVPFFCISCRFSSCRRLSTIKRNKQAAGCPSAALLDTILAYALCASRRPVQPVKIPGHGSQAERKNKNGSETRANYVTPLADETPGRCSLGPCISRTPWSCTFNRSIWGWDLLQKHLANTWQLMPSRPHNALR